MNYHFFKRIFDITASLIGIIILSPIFVVISITLLFSIGFPILFRQIRPGYKGKPFTILKFRSMDNVRDRSGQILHDSMRLTSVGKILRSTSLDELPELLNVIKGEMSLVGPRPLLMQYLDRYTPEQMRRHEVKPGITGWAQINGRNAISWEEKFKLDVWYVEHQSFLLDLKIILLTVWKIFRREGINQPGQATAEEFKGTI